MSYSFINNIFKAKQARTGGIVRRSIASVERYASIAILKAEVARRGFRWAIMGDQFLIYC